jgi:ABC-type nitrate/sulfonate/bicarbonate transport system substrate-binding protein
MSRTGPLLTRRGFSTGVASTAMAGPAIAQSAPQVTMALSSTSFGLAAVLMASKAGLFAKQGIEPRLIVSDSGSAAMTALVAGSVQFSAAGPGEALAARARQQPVVILCNVYRGLAASVALARTVADKLSVKPDAPIDARLRALDGLIVGVPSATSAYLAPIKNPAEAVGAKPRFVYMSQPAMVAALNSGSIQAMIAGSPFWGETVLKGTAVLWISGAKGDLPARVLPASSACIETTEAYAKANPDVIGRVQAAIKALGELIRNDPASGKRALALAYPQLSQEAIDLAFSGEAASWTQPILSEADLRHEIDLLRDTGRPIPGLDSVSPAQILAFEK